MTMELGTDKTALVVVDMQNIYCRDGGRMAKLGFPWERLQAAAGWPPPGDALTTAHGVPGSGDGFRETQSRAFLSTPGILRLYSGVAMITPSA